MLINNVEQKLQDAFPPEFIKKVFDTILPNLIERTSEIQLWKNSYIPKRLETILNLI